jgi:multiple sugar transport system substrate-binding protein
MSNFRRLSIVILCMLMILVSFTSPSLAQTDWAKEPMKTATEVVISVNAGSNEKALNNLVDGLKKDLNIDLKVVGLPFEEQYGLQYLDLQSGANQYDLYVFWPMYMADFAPYLTPLSAVAPDGETQAIKDLNFDDVAPAYRWVWYFGDKLYGVQMDGDVKLLHYRTDLTEDPANKSAFKAKYGYEYDMQNLTWEQYLDVAKFFTEQGKGVFGASEVADFLAGFFWKDRLVGMGGHLFDYDMNPCYPSLDVCTKVFQNGLDTFAKGSTPEGKSNNFDDARVQFQREGRTVMHTMWPEGWRLANKAGQGTSVACKVDVAEMPGFKNADGKLVRRVEMAGGRVIGLSNSAPAEVKEAAYKVLAYISRPEIALGMITNEDTLLDPWTKTQMQASNFTYAVSTCDNPKERAQHYVDILTASTEHGYPAIQIPGAGRYFEVYERLSRAAFSGQITAEEAAKTMVSEFNAITDSIGRDSQVKAYRQYVDTVLKPLGLWDEKK